MRSSISGIFTPTTQPWAKNLKEILTQNITLNGSQGKSCVAIDFLETLPLFLQELQVLKGNRTSHFITQVCRFVKGY